MTEIEAIKEIKSWTSILLSAGSKCTLGTAEAQKMAIEALEKQEERNKVIDDFAESVEIWCWKHEEYDQDDLNELMEIAEELKRRNHSWREAERSEEE